MYINEQITALYALLVISDLSLEKGIEWTSEMVDH
jgi:hypothetical protein